MEEDGRVQFDPARPDRSLSHEDAQALLCKLATEQPRVFWVAWQEVVTGQPARKKRARAS